MQCMLSRSSDEVDTLPYKEVAANKEQGAKNLKVKLEQAEYANKVLAR